MIWLAPSCYGARGEVGRARKTIMLHVYYVCTRNVFFKHVVAVYVHEKVFLVRVDNFITSL